MESVLPVPALPSASITPAVFSVIRLLVSIMLAPGVRVAVQVLPPSLLLRALKVPLATIRSALMKPLTASEKVMVTVVVWPSFRALSATMTVAVGRWVSMT
ncbi:hypothetical protein D3C71_1915430 [compost metagenome]